MTAHTREFHAPRTCPPHPEVHEMRTMSPTNEPQALYRDTGSDATAVISRTVIYELMRSGRLRTVTEGRCRRIPASAIAEYVELLETESTRAAG